MFVAVVSACDSLLEELAGAAAFLEDERRKTMASEAKTRPARVAAELRQEIARLISRDLGDPRLEGLVVANVTMTGDLRMAKIFWRLATLDEPGPLLDLRRKETQTALERASGRLKRAVTGRLQLRVAPELKFEYDAGQEKRDRIDQLLEEVKKDRGPE